MIRICLLIAAVLAVTVARPEWSPTGNYTDGPRPYPTREPSPLDKLKDAVSELIGNAENVAYNIHYLAVDGAMNFVEEIEDSVVERVEDLADLIDDINNDHFD